jgi:hypothetical protein
VTLRQTSCKCTSGLQNLLRFVCEAVAIGFQGGYCTDGPSVVAQLAGTVKRHCSPPLTLIRQSLWLTFAKLRSPHDDNCLGDNVVPEKLNAVRKEETNEERKERKTE